MKSETPNVSEAARAMGAIGGLAGGPRKRRGGPAYYAKLARVRWAKAKKNSKPNPSPATGAK